MERKVSALTLNASANKTKLSSKLRGEGGLDEGERGTLHCGDKYEPYRQVHVAPRDKARVHSLVNVDSE